MVAAVDPSSCIGCGRCSQICPEVFEMDGEVAIVKADPVPEEYEDQCWEAVEECPVTAISISGYGEYAFSGSFF